MAASTLSWEQVSSSIRPRAIALLSKSAARMRAPCSAVSSQSRAYARASSRRASSPTARVCASCTAAHVLWKSQPFSTAKMRAKARPSSTSGVSSSASAGQSARVSSSAGARAAPASCLVVRLAACSPASCAARSPRASRGARPPRSLLSPKFGIFGKDWLV